MAENKDKVADTPKPEASTSAAAVGEKKKLPQLGALEDDDEFEVCHDAVTVLQS